MKLPRDLGGIDLAKSLGRYGYRITRQTGSHLRLTTHEGGEHHLTIPSHRALRVGRSIKKTVPFPKVSGSAD